jgi:DNA polymerase-3 subunit epsilon
MALISQALNDESMSTAEREELNVVAANLSIMKSRLAELIKMSKELRAKSLSRNLVALPESWKLGEPLRVGQKVVFTGCNPEWRSEFEKEAKKVGVAISSKVSKKTSFLITDGSYVGNKANDAAALGVRVVSPDEFELLLKYLQPALTQ